MDNATLREALHEHGVRLADTAVGRLEARVPTCPEWNVGELVGHVGGVHRWAIDVVRGKGARPESFPQGHSGDDDVLEWYRSGLAALEELLRGTDADDEAWTFGPADSHRVGWWIRRQALETAVHRWDADAATAGTGVTIEGFEPELAAVGIEEYLTEVLPRMLREPVPGLQGTFHLHATDAESEWLIDLSAEAPVAERGHAKCDTSVRGPASDIYLWLWNRLSPTTLEILGSAAVIDAWALKT
jgi:uncharacterized protein (TIGR03083 family)